MDIEHWRNEIDELDQEILRLLNMRARLAIKVGALKKIGGLSMNDPERERAVLNRLQEINTGPLDSAAITRLFRRIIYESRRIQLATVVSSRADASLSSSGNGFSQKETGKIA
jgi:chorismate mutase